jgi:hypothetical protein
MVVTEKEAKGKFCPDIYAGAMLEKASNSNCAASSCMMWRWAEDYSGPRDTDDPRKGFCGKAGYPMEILDV